MNERASYMLQVLEKVGSPLLSAAIVKAGSGDAAKDAETLAGLLTRSVKTGIDLGEGLDLSALGVDSDAMRLALTALASGLVAAAFEKEGALPGDDQMGAIISAAKPLKKFAENFEPGAAHVRRLEELGAAGQPVDAYQAHVQALNAFIPVVNAVFLHPLGGDPAALTEDIAGKLTAKASDLRKAHFEDLDEDDAKRVELGLTRALSSLYASCHGPQNGESPEKIWEAFELRVSVLSALTNHIVTGKSAATESGSMGLAAQASPVTEVAEAPTTPPPTPPTTPPATTSAPPASPAGAGANPMSMFVKKPDADSSAPSSDPPPPADPAPPADTPEEKPADEQPPASGNGGNPMSFFSGKKKEGE